jgi:amidase
MGDDNRIDSMAPAVSRAAVPALAAGAARYVAPRAAATNGTNELVMMDATALASAIRSRTVSCVEVMTAYLDHIERINPKVNAIVALQDRAELLLQARERDKQLERSNATGPLHGFPLAVKDLQAVKGIRTTLGSRIFKDSVPSTDSMMVARLRSAGAIFVGKTNTPEFGLGAHTYNLVYGATRNAYDPSRSAGGSSGGAAVALALRMLPLADGSDYGGSLRNPAGWNNVFGLRASIGRIPGDSLDAWLPSMSVTGPMARNVTDLALLLAVQAGYDARAPLCIDGDGSIFQGQLARNVKGKRIAWGADFKGYTPCEPAVLEVCRTAMRTFESLGCTVEESIPDFDLDAVWQALVRLRGWQQGSSLLAYYNDPVQRTLLKPEAIFEVETGLRQSAYDISAASTVRTDWYHAVRRFFERYDYLVVPSAQVLPFDVELHWPREVAGRRMQTYHEWMKASLLITMSGCPALAAPAGFSEQGLPIGIQIVGPSRSELECLQLAYAYEQASNWTDSYLPMLLGRA